MKSITTVGLVIAVLLSFTACDDDGTTPTLGNTPAQVLRSLIYAFNNGDIETLDGALADDFTFHFDPINVGTVIGDYVIPDSWGREDFITACGNMFTEAYSIDLDVAYESIGGPEDGATEFTARDVYVRLLVMVDSTNGFIGDGFCDFRFVNESADGTGNWVISDWWDYTAARGTYESSVDTSLGLILAGFAE